jgi:glycosyltransferase involved in cell wall biosynthesis
MSKRRPLISILIPTRERVGTLRYAIESALDQDFNDYEVIVSDNVSRDGTRELVESFASQGVRYAAPPSRVSMSDNFECALEASSGRYVIIIGDDDAIVPGAIAKIAALIASKRTRIVAWTRARYFWPMAGRSARTCPVPRHVEQRMDLARAAKLSARFGGAGAGRLVSPYHSCVERSVLDEIKAKVGRVFATSMPDIFLDYAIPPIVPTAIHTSFVASVNGISARSNSAVEHLDKRYTEFEAESKQYSVHPSLYRGWNETTLMLADCMLVAVDAFPQFYTRGIVTNEAVLAYLCSKPIPGDRTLSGFGVLKRRNEIRKQAPLNIARFVAWRSIHRLLRARRIVLGDDWREEQATTLANVHEFAKTIAQASN